MPIPYGLLGQTDVEKKKRGPLKKGEGYWLGSQYMFPEVGTAPPVGMAPPPPQPLFTPIPSAPQQGGILGPVWAGGDGPQGEGSGGGNGNGNGNGTSPSFSESGHVNAPDPTMSQGIPSLPSFQEQAPAPTAPAVGLAPAPDLKDMAVSEVDPQGTPGAAKGTAQAANPAHNEQGLAARSAVNKSIADDQAAIGKAIGVATAFTDAVAGIAKSSPAISAQDSSDMGSRAAVAAENSAPAGVKGSSQNAPGAVTGQLSPAKNDFLSPTEVAAINAAVAASNGGASNGGTQGGIGATGNPGPGNDTSGTAAADAGGSWRKGGPVPDDGDEKLEPVRGILHEREFVLRPEAAQYYGKGILGALNAKAIPKAKLTGLLRL